MEEIILALVLRNPFKVGRELGSKEQEGRIGAVALLHRKCKSKESIGVSVHCLNPMQADRILLHS